MIIKSLSRIGGGTSQLLGYLFRYMTNEEKSGKKQDTKDRAENRGILRGPMAEQEELQSDIGNPETQNISNASLMSAQHNSEPIRNIANQQPRQTFPTKKSIKPMIFKIP